MDRERFMLKYGRWQSAVPHSYFLNYISTKCFITQSAWVVCKFAKDPTAEHLLAVGDEIGVIHFLDVEENNFRSRFHADRSCIIDVSFVANRPNNLLSISGHAKVTSWDIERQQPIQQFVGHDGSVRALSVSDDNPDLFATGARDGTICVWDQRERYAPRPSTTRPYNVLDNTHPLLNHQRLSVGMKRRSRASLSTTSKGVTSLIHVGANTLISASSSFKTGIRFWDLRYRGKTEPFRILSNPNSASTRDFGIASLCLDRFSSTLFAASTDSKIYQYTIQGSASTPVGVLQGAKRSSFNNYDFRIAASPITDHVIFGGGDCFAVVWDLQEKYQSYNYFKQKFLPYPKYTLGGHHYEVTVATFSNTGRYIVTMDDSYLKIWEWNSKDVKNSGLSPELMDSVELYQLPETALAEISMKQLNVTPKKSQCCTPKKNPERSPFKSPFKSPLNRVSADAQSNSSSPVRKMLKTSATPLSPPLSEITNSANSSFRAARKLDFSSISESSSTKKTPCAFYYKYPTMNLPDFVKDRLAASNANLNTSKINLNSQAAMEMDERESPSSSQNRPSNCSNVVSMVERVERTSPHKISMNERLRKPRESAHRQSMPKMSNKSRSRSTGQGVKPAETREPSSAVAGAEQVTPKSNKGQRTLDQYFSKTPRTC